MTTTQRWLDGYLRAWEAKDAEAVRALFADDAEYWFQPHDPSPVRGIDAIVEMWREAQEPTAAQPDLRVLVEHGRLGIITGTVEYPGHSSYSNLWEVHFAEDGRAHRFVEWYMPRDKNAGE